MNMEGFDSKYRYIHVAARRARQLQSGAPAMNVNMWEHPATQANLVKLRDRGMIIVEPDAGYLACGMVGAGRLAANEHIVAVVNDVLSGAARSSSGELAGETVL